ncbi:MAG: YjbH domain-containing protein [Bacteroidales bacterium]|nr:YjbH domain-containing protein [Bacteroidales bacterium]MDD3988522.1 YjbH domain-containing protein [Bacteroidales bacterium]MDD4638209.1 YjbH domain-containing protein [Bacteroidales bacterium]
MFLAKQIFWSRLPGAILLLLVSSYSLSLKGQSTIGMSGLLNSPSAYMAQDGTVKLGGNFLNKALTPDRWNYHTVNFFANITFLPFFEVALNNTVLDLVPEGRFNNVDRSINLKLRVLKEGKYHPAVAIGSNDFLTTTTLITSGGGNKFFGKAYIAASKSFKIKKQIIGFHLAYNHIVSDYLTQKLPVSGGISYSPSFYNKLSFIVEYDSNNFNGGANIVLLKYIYFQFLMQNFKDPSAGFHIQFPVK